METRLGSFVNSATEKSTYQLVRCDIARLEDIDSSTRLPARYVYYFLSNALTFVGVLTSNIV